VRNFDASAAARRSKNRISLTYDGHRFQVRGTTNVLLGSSAGVFAKWGWNGKTLTATNCSLGFRPLFYRLSATGIALSDHPGGVLEEGDHAALDSRALSVFLRLGFFLGEDTAFHGIRQLAPASTLTWSSSGMRLHTGDRLAGEPIRTSREAATREFAALLEAAVQEAARTAECSVLPLSGGRDSRHIAFALARSVGKPICAVTSKHLPPRADEDVRIARLVASALGAEHVVIEQPSAAVEQMYSAVAEAGFLSDEMGWLSPLVAYLSEKRGTVYDGIAGDVMSAGLFQGFELHDALVGGRTDEAATLILNEWRSSCAGWEELIRDPGLKSALREEIARDRLREELSRHVQHPNPARSFYFWNRTRREIALVPFMLLGELDVSTPYLHPRLWRFLDGLPYEMVADRRFHDQTIAIAYPQHNVIPYEDKSTERHTGLAERLGFAAGFLRLAAGSSRHVARPALLRRTLGLLRTIDPWWSPKMALYLCALMDLQTDLRIDR
jgi:asparagine synthase (glutamine-hydrolysing)